MCHASEIIRQVGGWTVGIILALGMTGAFTKRRGGKDG